MKTIKINFLLSLLLLPLTSCSNNEITIDRAKSILDDIKCYQPRTKFVQKQESNLTKQKIKRYSR